jgi:hypothetical protein
MNLITAGCCLLALAGASETERVAAFKSACQLGDYDYIQANSADTNLFTDGERLDVSRLADIELESKSPEGPHLWMYLDRLPSFRTISIEAKVSYFYECFLNDDLKGACWLLDMDPLTGFDTEGKPIWWAAQRGHWHLVEEWSHKRFRAVGRVFLLNLFTSIAKEPELFDEVRHIPVLLNAITKGISEANTDLFLEIYHSMDSELPTSIVLQQLLLLHLRRSQLPPTNFISGMLLLIEASNILQSDLPVEVLMVVLRQALLHNICL